MLLNNIKDVIPFTIYKWSDCFAFQFSKENIIKIFHKYQVHESFSSYPAGLKIPMSTRDTFRFIIAGECCYFGNNKSIVVKAGEFILLPEGQYTFKVTDNSMCEIISIWIYPVELINKIYKEKV